MDGNFLDLRYPARACTGEVSVLVVLELVVIGLGIIRIVHTINPLHSTTLFFGLCIIYGTSYSAMNYLYLAKRRFHLLNHPALTNLQLRANLIKTMRSIQILGQLRITMSQIRQTSSSTMISPILIPLSLISGEFIMPKIGPRPRHRRPRRINILVRPVQKTLYDPKSDEAPHIDALEEHTMTTTPRIQRLSLSETRVQRDEFSTVDADFGAPPAPFLPPVLRGLVLV